MSQDPLEPNETYTVEAEGIRRGNESGVKNGVLPLPTDLNRRISHYISLNILLVYCSIGYVNLTLEKKYSQI